MGVEGNARQSPEDFSKSITEMTGRLDEDMLFPSFQATLEYVSGCQRTRELYLPLTSTPMLAVHQRALLLFDKRKG